MSKEIREERKYFCDDVGVAVVLQRPVDGPAFVETQSAKQGHRVSVFTPDEAARLAPLLAYAAEVAAELNAELEKVNDDGGK